MARRRVLLVDDDRDLLRLLALRLEAAGYEVATAESGEAALGWLASDRPDVIITDLRMDGMDGMRLFEAVRARDATLPVIILTAHGSIPEAVEATRKGVFGFLTKPFDSAELLREVERAVGLAGGPAAEADGAKEAWREGIVTASPAMEALLRRARLVAQSEASVLIRGESGTGKELLARAIHRASPRAGRAFVAVNCGAIPEALLESELFGHRRGAFTGATQDHEGLFQAADGGTVFLDEIGDMPLALQVKLLRVLQERQVRPVGAVQPVPVDVRIISATHRDLEAEVAAGRFREDLYYRINVVSLELPRLAERREDIPMLARHFLRQLAERYGRRVRDFSPEAMAALTVAAWPGNVRQLYNVVEQVVTLGTGPIVPESLVREALREAPRAIPSFAEARREFERGYLAQVLRMTGGNVSQAARIAGRNRTEFYKLLRRCGLDPARFKPGRARERRGA